MRQPVSIVVSDWETLREPARAIRFAVFVEEQQVPIELEWDEFDVISWHAVAYKDVGNSHITNSHKAFLTSSALAMAAPAAVLSKMHQTRVLALCAVRSMIKRWIRSAEYRDQ